MEVSFAVSGPGSGGGSGWCAAYGEGRFPAASVVKVGILAALLLRARDEGRALAREERRYAEAMIRRSDNDAASALWAVIGGAAGLDAAQGRLGLTRTAADLAWGRTRTTARDQVALLRAVFGAGPGVLDEESRTYIGALMGQVVAGQDWGVSAAGSGAALKNGWMPRDATGLWAVHSIGRVEVDGRGVLVAVLSEGHTTKEAGIAVVEAVARAAVGAAFRRTGGRLRRTGGCP